MWERMWEKEIVVLLHRDRMMSAELEWEGEQERAGESRREQEGAVKLSERDDERVRKKKEGRALCSESVLYVCIIGPECIASYDWLI